MRRRRVSVLFLVALALGLVARADTVQDLQRAALADLWAWRGQARAIVALYRAYGYLDATDSPAAFEKALQQVLNAPDAAPEVKAQVAHLLARQDRDLGKVQEAQRLEAQMGYVLSWRVIGPFDDENKQGFDAVYPPETKLDMGASYVAKSHPVSWRAVPERLVNGVVPLDQVMDPTENVAGYALTFIRVPKDTPCVLRGGYNEAYKLWVDGDLVASRKRYNGRAFDQFADGCTLRKGWNALLVKVCNSDGGWNFELRLTDEKGRALSGWTSTSDPAAVKEPLDKVLAKNGLPPKGMEVNDPGEALKARSESHPDAGSLEDYGQYLLAMRTFDRGDTSHLEILRKAAEASSSDPVPWLVLGDAERDHNKRRADYQKALDVAPKNPLALERMARHYLDRGMPFPALQYLDRAVAAEPDCLPTRALQCQVRLQFASEGIGDADLQALYSAHPGCAVVQLAYLASLRKLGDPAQETETMERYRETHQEDTGAWYDAIADEVRTGHTGRVLELFTQMEARFPLDRMLIYRHASYLLAQNQPKEAEGLVAAALKWCPDWPEGHDLQGDLLRALGDSSKALAEYQAALTLRPQMESVKRKVSFLSPQGEGFESQYRVEPKDLPTALGTFSGQQAVVLLDNTAIKVQPSGLSSRYVQMVIQVLQPAAAQQLQTWPITFDPDRQEVRILDASILKPDGTKVHADVMVTDALSDPRYRLYYRNRNMVLSFPSLSAGDRLWIEYKISDIGERNEYGRYFGDIETFAGQSPILLKQYTLIMPSDLPLYVHAERLSTEPIVVTRSSEKIYRWVVRDIPQVEQEPDMPGFTDVLPYLHVSTFQDWDAMGAWYAKFISDQWQVTPEVKAKVAELIQGATTTEAKVSAIHRWVVQQTHYVGLEFGVHGFRPYKVGQIFERRFGDCKDKAILTAAMLRQAGLDACMVLVRTRDLGSIYPTPASLAIFNHAITYVPELNLFLDGTAEYSGLHELPYQDQGVWVQLVWPDGRTKRMETPVDKAADNQYRAVYRVEVPASGTSAEARGAVTVIGQQCAWLRRRFQDKDKLREQLEKDISGAFPGTHLSSATASDLADLSSPVTFSFDGTLGQVVSPDGEHEVSLPVWMGQLNLFAGFAALAQRHYPLEIDYPWVQEYDVTFTLPRGATAKAMAPVSIHTPFGSVTRTFSGGERQVSVKLTVELGVREVSPQDYPAFRAFCQAADKAAGERLRVQLAGGKP